MFSATSKFIKYLTFCLAFTALSACERTSPSNTDPDNQPRTRAEQDLAELREWLGEKTENIDSVAEEKWPEIKEEFKEKTARLDAELDSLSAESKEEYKELRRKYQNWEARNEQRLAIPLSPEILDRFEQELLGSATALETKWQAHEVRDIYTRFLQNVRNNRSGWTASDWDYADEIYSHMNAKKDPLEDAIPVKDKLKIKALQAEFLTLETRKDTKDLVRSVQ